MLGSRINVLRTRSAPAPDNPLRLTIFPRYPHCSVPLTPPPPHTTRTLQFLKSILPPSLACQCPPHASIPLKALQRLPSSRLPSMLAIQNMITHMRAPWQCSPLVRGCE